MYFIQKFSPACFGRHSGHPQDDDLIEVFKNTNELAVPPSLTNNITNLYTTPSAHQLQPGLKITKTLRQASLYIDQKILTPTILVIINF